MKRKTSNESCRSLLDKPEFKSNLDQLRLVDRWLDDNPLKDWPAARYVFQELEQDMQAVLIDLSRKRDPRFSGGPVNCLRLLGLIAEPDSGTEICKEDFAAWIRSNHTFAGKTKRLAYRLRHRGDQVISTSESRRPRLWTALAFLFLGLPVLLMLAPFMNYQWLQERLIPVFGDNLWIDPFRYYAIAIVVAGVTIYFATKISSDSPHYKLKLVLSIVVSATLLLWLGLPFHLVLMFALFFACDVLAFYSFARAWRELPVKGNESTNPKLYDLLQPLADKDKWKSPHEWREPQILLMVMLSVTGLLYFNYLFTPKETPVGGTISNGTVLAPSWLSYRDEGTIVLSLTSLTETTIISGTVLLEPDPESLAVVIPHDQDICGPSCTWGPLANPIDRSTQTISAGSGSGGISSEHSVLTWRVQTAARSIARSDMKWRLRLSLCSQDSGTLSECTEHLVNISRMRLGFGLWGFLEAQPLVNIVSIIFGIAYAVVQIWINNLLILGRLDRSTANTVQPTIKE